MPPGDLVRSLPTILTCRPRADAKFRSCSVGGYSAESHLLDGGRTPSRDGGRGRRGSRTPAALGGFHRGQRMGGVCVKTLSRSLCLRRPARSSRSHRPITNTNLATSSIEGKDTGEARRQATSGKCRFASVRERRRPYGIDRASALRLARAERSIRARRDRHCDAPGHTVQVDG